ncbi:hexose transporter [Pseudohyphozyma bogoriensis]|nr:hexose transporter [Pseudohyphozyma bogoriensis]
MVSSGGNTAGAIASIAHIKNNTHRNWWMDPGLRKLNLFIVILFLASASGGFDGSLINGLESIPRWFTDLGNPDTKRQSLIIASQSIGGVAAFLVSPWLPDVIGRKWTIVVGNAIIIAGAVGQTFTHDSGAYIGTRMIIGFGGVICAVASPSLATELAHPRQFGKSWMAFGTLNLSPSWSWRLPTLFQAVPALFQIVVIPFCPESPRHLLRQGREEEAKAVLLKYHANGAEQDDLVDFQMSEIKQQLINDAELNNASFSMFFKTAGMRKRLAIVIIVAFMSHYTQTSGINGGLAVWNAFWAIAGASNVDRLGRRTLWLTSTIGMLVSYIIVTALSATYARTPNQGVGYGVIVFLFIFFAFYDIALTPLTVGYPTEILPTKARAKGLGIEYLCVYIALVFNSYLNPIALDALGWKYYLVYVFILAAMVVTVYFFFPETRGKSLEEISDIFDHKDLQHEAEAAREEGAPEDAKISKTSIAHLE